MALNFSVFAWIKSVGVTDLNEALSGAPRFFLFYNSKLEIVSFHFVFTALDPKG